MKILFTILALCVSLSSFAKDDQNTKIAIGVLGGAAVVNQLIKANDRHKQDMEDRKQQRDERRQEQARRNRNDEVRNISILREQDRRDLITAHEQDRRDLETQLEAERKRAEIAIKLAAAEIARSDAELKQAQNRTKILEEENEQLKLRLEQMEILYGKE